MGLIIAIATTLIIGSHQWGISEGHYESNKYESMYCSADMSVKECNERINNKGPSNVEKVEKARRGQHE